MSNVLEFKRKDAADQEPGSSELPHATGPAFCMRCDHEWDAVAPVGTTVLECPDCKAMAGQFRFLCKPEAPVWTCPCGSQLFHITSEGHFCPNCGIWQRY